MLGSNAFLKEAISTYQLSSPVTLTSAGKNTAYMAIDGNPAQHRVLISRSNVAPQLEAQRGIKITVSSEQEGGPGLAVFCKRGMQSSVRRRRGVCSQRRGLCGRNMQRTQGIEVRNLELPGQSKVGFSEFVDVLG